MLNDPNIESPANIDAAKLFWDNPTEYKKLVKKFTWMSVESI